MSSELEVQASRDRSLGLRIRHRWKEIMVHARRFGLTEDQVRGFVQNHGLFASDEKRRELAASLGFDWEGAAEFFETIAPIIIEMMASCGA